MKKIFTIFAFMLVAFTGNAQSTQKGDVNGDGDISVNDVAMIVNYILGITDSNFIIANADINGDGEIDINDVMGTRPRPALRDEMGVLQCGGFLTRRVRWLLCLGRDKRKECVQRSNLPICHRSGRRWRRVL